MLSKLAAFGIWPALPVTGYWLFTRVSRISFEHAFPPITSFGLMSVAGIAVWSVPMLASAIVGAYRAEYFGLLGWAVTLYALVGLLRGRRDGRWQERLNVTAWDWVLAAGLIVAGGLYLAFPHDSILGGRDQGVYANHGIYIAHHGKLAVPHPWPASYDSIFRENFEAYSGLYQTEPTMTMQFSQLFPVWLAQAFSTMGHHGLFRLNGMLALLFLLIFYGVCRLAVPKSYAVVATLFLGLNPSELWLARITLSEIPAQLFIWSGLLLLLSALKMGHSGLMRWAGIFLGFSALVRIDSLVLVPMLFLSHLAYKIVRGPTEEDSLSIWPVLYQTALPVFLLAVGYYAVFSSPYFDALSSHLQKIGLAAFFALFALLVTTPRIVRTVRPWLTGRATLVLIGSALLALAVYAYWIRPNMVPYSMITKPGYPLHGTRDYRENSLVNLTRYLSPLVVSIAIFGWLVSLWTLVLKRQSLHLIALLVVVAGFSGLYLWNPYVAPYHFWAVRRFVPVVIPGFVLCAVLGAWSIVPKLPKAWASAASAFVMIFLSVVTLRADALILGFAENKGYFVQLKQLAETLPLNELILAHGESTWIDPLYIAFDRKVIPIDLGTEKARNLLKIWSARQISEQKPVYLLREETLPLPGLHKLKTEEVVLSRSYSESTPEPLPRRILSEQRTIGLYKIIGVSERWDYRNMNLGARMVWGVEESGFHGQEWHGGIPLRWTNGVAKLVVPVDAHRPPRALRVDLASTSPQGSHLRIFVNGSELFNGDSPAGSWSRNFGLSGLPLGQRATIELLSSTFRPSDMEKGNVDSRTLGVSVQSIRLLESQQPLSSAPLSDTGYRSQLSLEKKTPDLTMTAGQTAQVEVWVRNVGDDPWPVHTDLGQEKGSVNLGILWFAKGQTEKRLAEDRAKLPYAMFHEDEAQIDVNLAPVGYDGKRFPPGHYEVWIGLVQEHVAWFYQKGDNVLKLLVEVKA